MMLRVSSKITVFKLDSTGTLVWQRDYAAGVDAYFQFLALTSDGGAIVSGTVSKQRKSVQSGTPAKGGAPARP